MTFLGDTDSLRMLYQDVNGIMVSKMTGNECKDRISLALSNEITQWTDFFSVGSVKIKNSSSMEKPMKIFLSNERHLTSN